MHVLTSYRMPGIISYSTNVFIPYTFTEVTWLTSVEGEVAECKQSWERNL